MLDTALKVLKKIEQEGYRAYIVGGFVRDYLVNRNSKDIDINTNATPQKIKEIFPNSFVLSDDYGTISVMYKNIRFEITTFRKESYYKNHRKPETVHYIDDVYPDLLRRDFTINAICMDSYGNIFDPLHGKDDLDEKMIRTIGDSDKKLEEDALRILRAVRLATTLDFSLSLEVKDAISKYKGLLKEISYERKKQELDKIFTSSYAHKGIQLLLSLGLDKELELPRLKDLRYTGSLIGIWAMLDVLDIYPFTTNEKDLIEKIQLMYQANNFDPYNLYKYGLYVNSVAGEIKGESVKEITEAYQQLSIQSRSDIAVDGDDIVKALKREPGPYLSDIYEDLEKEILYHRLKNEKEELLRFCLLKMKEEE